MLVARKENRILNMITNAFALKRSIYNSVRNLVSYNLNKYFKGSIPVYTSIPGVPGFMTVQIATVDARLNYYVLNYMRTAMQSSVIDFSKLLFDRHDI